MHLRNLRHTAKSADDPAGLRLKFEPYQTERLFFRLFYQKPNSNAGKFEQKKKGEKKR